jgi:hypothetical protein
MLVVRKTFQIFTVFIIGIVLSFTTAVAVELLFRIDGEPQEIAQIVTKSKILFNPPPSYTKKKSIQSLNYSEGSEGINPLNGGLMLHKTDMVVPGRGLTASIGRFYSSKRVWVYDVLNGNSVYQTLKKPGLLGLGWNMNFGKLYVEDGNYVYESSGGEKNTFISGKTYDGAYMAKRGDSVYTKDGRKIVWLFRV